MKTYRLTGTGGNRRSGRGAFTIIEVVFATAIAALVLAGMFRGYNMAGQKAQFSAWSLAANTTAMRQMEQVIAATWIPSYTNFSSNANQLFSPSLTNPVTGNLCLPSANGNVVTCTNYTTITQVSTTPPYAMIEVQCVWGF